MHGQGSLVMVDGTKVKANASLAANRTYDGIRQEVENLQQAQANLQAAGVDKPIRAVVADAGYWSDANVRQAPAEGPELFLATSKEWKQRQAWKDAPPPRGRIPKGLSLRQTVEPVFGQIKTVRGADRFLRRGHSPDRQPM